MNKVKFYHDWYNRLCILILMLTLLITLMIGSLMIRFFFREEPAYYATSMDGKLGRLSLVDCPDNS